MAQESQYVCDGCLEVVHGRVKGQFYHRDYIQFKGTMILQQQDPKTKQGNYTYLTYLDKRNPDPKFQGEELSFCVKAGMPCIEKFLTRRREQIRYHREQKRIETMRDIRKQEILDGGLDS